MVDTKMLIRKLLVDAGTNAKQTSLLMNKNFGYITNILIKDTSPTIATLEAIADALGYDVQVTFVNRKTRKVVRE